MVKRVEDVTTGDHLLDKDLRATLPGNGYPKNWIKLDRYTREESRGADKIDEEELKPLATATITIPYIQKAAKKLQHQNCL